LFVSTFRGSLPRAFYKFEFKSQFTADCFEAFVNCLGEQSHDEFDQFGCDGPNFGKNAVFEEWGVLPLDQGVAGRKKIQENYEDTLQKAKAGRIDEIAAIHQIKYFGTIEKIHKKERNKVRIPPMKWLRLSEGGKPKDLPHKWFYGPTGTGMSRRSINTLKRSRCL